VRFLCWNHVYPASTAARQQVKTGAKVLQIFTPVDFG
jgi:hypothetical protein